jgi:antagonist of KipI
LLLDRKDLFLKKKAPLKLLKKGIFSTYQAIEKNGLRHLGVNPGGAMDKLTVRLLNILLQNNENEPILEMHFPAAEILFEEDCIIIIGGADFMPMLDNQLLTNWKATIVKAGNILKFTKKITGNRVYLAIKNGLNANPTFLPYLTNSMVAHQLPIILPIRFVAGNEYQLLTKESKESLEHQGFMITQNSNRMGFRMKAEALEIEEKMSLISSAVDFGTMQLLPDGQMIILMADHQTSGGYPRIGNIISVDLPILAQCGTNDVIVFQQISIEEAEELLILQEKEIQKLETSIGYFYKKQ